MYACVVRLERVMLPRLIFQIRPSVHRVPAALHVGSESLGGVCPLTKNYDIYIDIFCTHKIMLYYLFIILYPDSCRFMMIYVDNTRITRANKHTCIQIGSGRRAQRGSRAMLSALTCTESSEAIGRGQTLELSNSKSCTEHGN